MSKRAVTKNIFKIHQLAGLISGLVLLIIGLSGSVLVFREEIDRAQLQPPIVHYNPAQLNIDTSFKKLRKEYQGAEIRLTNVTPKENESLCFSIRTPKERLGIYTHPVTGEILKRINSNNTIIVWMLNLHYNLHAGQTGKVVVLITGILFILSIITGFVIYRKSILKVLQFKSRINRKNKQTLSSSLHRTIGVWSLLLNLILAVTGVLISYSIAFPSAKKKTKKEIASKEITINITVDEVLASIKDQYPNYQPNFIRVPSGSKTMQIGGSLPGDFFLYSHYANKIQVELASGKMDKLNSIATKPFGDKFNEIIKPLHFGEYGGLPIKILYCFAGLSIPLLSITGFLLWTIRMKKAPKKSPNYSVSA
ncbi:PepSY-associated TM helix domain-containing protein [Solitalea canadensis]|uniref:Putative iron-regulated membrane protein n=1 Tax=Solitalea canadensis (strain ATCC 29591 / DSM 3403 / JCM 21819 / LMG 8368 / NBRC 15130 / NCIMB 12057 / USAM 9D) TaxID=929556 RepID=H8KTF7_SOLCM|nr:PepSY-associated TM helix domain-containing protein [Solitalea canadensis]AFD06294.1 putative iron-regulated membrane protein [Solitalea canadensis DSM 3403]